MLVKKMISYAAWAASAVNMVSDYLQLNWRSIKKKELLSWEIFFNNSKMQLGDLFKKAASKTQNKFAH